MRDVEQLEIDLDLEADAVAAAEQLDHQDDLPDQRQAGSRGGEEIRCKLRQDHVPQCAPARHVEALGHLGERRIERAGALAQRDHGGRKLVQRNRCDGSDFVQAEPDIDQHDHDQRGKVQQHGHRVVQHEIESPPASHCDAECAAQQQRQRECGRDAAQRDRQVPRQRAGHWSAGTWRAAPT